MALMVAVKVILSLFTISPTPTFKALSFAYLPGAMISILFGPCAALVFGFVSDTVGFLVKPMGSYFPGYAISEMLANFIYACFLYKKPIRVWRVIASRLAITLMITFGLNYLWNVIMFGQIASKYFTSVRLINNIVQFPLHVFMVIVFGRIIIKIYNTYIRQPI